MEDLMMELPQITDFSKDSLMLLKNKCAGIIERLDSFTQKADLLVSDFYHTIEFGNLDAVKLVQTASKLKKILQERRLYKNGSMRLKIYLGSINMLIKAAKLSAIQPTNDEWQRDRRVVRMTFDQILKKNKLISLMKEEKEMK